MRVTVLPSPEAVAARAAAEIAAALVAAVEARGVAHIALAGGTTPKAAYTLLAKQRALPWTQVHLWFGDERCVPPLHRDSNNAMVHEVLTSKVAANVHRMRGELPDREAAAAEYGESLPETFDLVVLGLGPDGHTASIFPGSPACNAVLPVVAVIAPKPPPARLTLTPGPIREARARLMIATGAEKARAVAAALTGPEDVERCPAVLARDGQWILDVSAAQLLAQAHVE